MHTTGRRWIVALPIAVVVALIVAACGGGGATPTSQPAATARPTTAPQATPTPQPTAAPTATATPAPKGPSGTLTIATDSLGEETWRSRLASGPEDPIIYSVLEQLIGADDQTRALQPRLATSWSVANAGSEWVWDFKLRQGVPFNEGKGEMTAQDVKASWAEMLKPDAKVSVAATAKALIRNDLNNFEIVGPYEFKLHAAALDVSVPNQFSALQPTLTIFPKAYYESVGDDGFQKHPIGTGPFVFKSHQRGSQVTLEAVPNHWRKTSDVQTVNFLIVPEDATRVAMLKTGQADMAPLPGAFKPELQSAGLRTFSVQKQANVYVSLGGMFPDLPEKNCTSCPWVGTGGNALKVREAMTIAIDRKAIIDKLLRGEGEPAAAPWMWTPGPFAFNDPKWQVPAYDPQRAKQLLAEAGYPNGFSIKFAIYSLAGFAAQADTAQAVANFWDDIGIKVDRQQIEFLPTFRTRMVERTTGGWAWVLNMGFQDEPLRSSRVLFTKTSALAYVHDPKFDEYVAKAGVEPDVDKRMALARDLGSYIVEQRLGVPLFSTNGLWGLGSRVKAWGNLVGYFYFGNLEKVILSR